MRRTAQGTPLAAVGSSMLRLAPLTFRGEMAQHLMAGTSAFAEDPGLLASHFKPLLTLLLGGSYTLFWPQWALHSHAQTRNF